MSSEKAAALISPIDDPILLKSPFFSNLSELEFNAVTAFMERRRIPKGTTVFKEGDIGDELFIMLSGELSAYVTQSDGGERRLFNVIPGDFFGEMSVIAKEPRSATIIAKDDTDIMVLQGIDFFRIIFEHPMIGAKLLKTICKVQNLWLDQSAKHLSDLMRWGETARRRAITDELTGLYNRRFLEESIKARFKHGSVGLRKMALMMMDLDKVHTINERHGSRAGDRVIITVAEILRTVMRSEDVSARLSGDEFAVLLPDTDGPTAKHIAERLRQTINPRNILVPETPESSNEVPIKVRVSIGIAVAPIQAVSEEGLFFTADNALRKAKALGRNRVELAN